MSLKHGLLGFLNYGDMTGYELNKAFKDSLNFFWPAHASQIYRDLAAMEKKEWLTSRRIMQEDKPNKRLYSITDDGKDELNKWLTLRNGDEGVCTRDAFLVKVFFSGEKTIDENIKMFEDYRDNCQKALNMRAKIDNNIDEYKKDIVDAQKAFYWMATAQYGSHHYSMCIAWANEMIEKMEAMR
ncbi:MAG: PadR family transcriptional regulator [Clostridia bacterium]|jgi:PadR family transcriptional regulator, regulatory protein AphA|nr:PadR family transcriptional regulator [Clostridia bacterium]